ncbi:MAG: GIY-YIG nuclease family protein [candidate division WOR-3 bacterium]
MIEVKKNIEENIGKLGKIGFEKGYYIYVGSAQSGVEKRVERHLKKEKRKFWHIDYLLSNENVLINEIYWKEGKKEGECKTAEKLLRYGKPITNFGCSDCGCKSHLFKINPLEIKLVLDRVNFLLFPKVK